MNSRESLHDPVGLTDGAPPRSPRWTSTLKAIFWTGLLAGTLDILAALTSTKISSAGDPTRILNGIAAGVFGNRAASGGVPMKLAGLFFHYVIAYSWTILFFVIQPRIRFLARHPIIGAILYCVVVWSVMNLVVVPITFSAPFKFNPVANMRGFLILTTVFTLPISLLARRHYSKNTAPGSP